jgi:membrane associated rhomboid family serine protease
VESVLKRRRGEGAGELVSQNGSGAEAHRDGDRQPALTAPWPPLLLTAALFGLYAWQRTIPDQEGLYYAYGLVPLQDGEGWRLVTALFVHGSWPHVVLNASFALAFGSGVARLVGADLRGAIAFFVFYLVCGIFAGWAYLELKAGAQVVLIGASGAVSGLMGGASRLLGRAPGSGELAPFLSPQVIGMAAAWIVLNLLIAGLGFAPGVGTAAVAWEAHLAGYAAGLLLIGPLAWLLGRAAPDAGAEG